MLRWLIGKSPTFRSKKDAEKLVKKALEENRQAAGLLREKIKHCKATLNGDETWGICLTRDNVVCGER